MDLAPLSFIRNYRTVGSSARATGSTPSRISRDLARQSWREPRSPRNAVVGIQPRHALSLGLAPTFSWLVVLLIMAWRLANKPDRELRQIKSPCPSSGLV
jgi:hypothetical protein